ncbi:NAD(P)/FAD-dependent oxidoreductase [Rhodococcus spongiicola]|uniref:NAD(P)/FAD-dependent oxidoreductase n=1 Tax=Rhodococcus spongiicola TaxID=2487352 RepID=A0A438AWW4_9NOCA|nr:NAD(P)/FAD-dependent oxidoreductase [Rhodococcus spongiicola]RVW03213.1 NAD(P)/FAD-dependent oxidoreductase [Rhodococcus spongiicola]
MTKSVLPPTAPTILTPQERVDRWLASFESALSDRDIARVAAMFTVDSFWRDLVAFTWNIATVEGHDGVTEMLRARLDDTDPSNFRTTEVLEEEVPERDGVRSALIEFETATGRGKGHLRLEGDQAWTLLTTMEELKGHEERRGPTRVNGAVHGSAGNTRSWAERREIEERELGYTCQPYVLVIGGGQGGIVLGARLRQLGVPALVVDRHERPGDQWRERYKSLCLYDPVWFSHLPYLPFPDSWPVFSPKDKLGDWLEMYTKVMEIPYWASTRCMSAKFDEELEEWTAVLDRSGQRVVLHPKHVVLATGVHGEPHVPDFPGRDVFHGEQHHSSQHPGPDAYADKRVVVIGSNSSAHDICLALYENGADVTMVQRSSTHVVKSETLRDLIAELYSEDALAAGITTEKADLISAAVPYKIMPEFQIPVYEKVAERDRDLYDRLAKAGFKLDFGDDGSGLSMKFLRRGSGFYVDLGASDLVADGSIRLASGQVEKLTEDAVVLADGTELSADLVVYATGYGSMSGRVADLMGQAVADKVGRCWGLGSATTKDPGPWEGELRNMWKPTRQEGLWFQGGGLSQARQYSLYLALQLKARYEGIATPVYGLPEVHHLS